MRYYIVRVMRDRLTGCRSEILKYHAIGTEYAPSRIRKIYKKIYPERPISIQEIDAERFKKEKNMDYGRSCG